MDNAIYVGVSRQMVLRREMDIIANNIANLDTTGFKVESLMHKTDPAAPAHTQGGPRPVKFVAGDMVARDFGQVGMPSDGRYVRRPAVTDATGAVVEVPPPVPNALPKIVLAGLVLGGVAYGVARMLRKEEETPRGWWRC